MNTKNNYAVPWKFRPWQSQVYKNMKGKSRVCIVVHRRAGKTHLFCGGILMEALKEPNQRFAYIAPELKQAKRITWDIFKDLLVYLPKDSVNFNNQELIITLPNKSKIYLLGAENAESIRGMGFKGVILDEVQDIPRSVWEKIVSPTLENIEGSFAWFSGTPKGQGFLWELLQKGRNEENTAWYTDVWDAHRTKVLTSERIDELKRDNSYSAFNQEYMCDFAASNEGAVYKYEVEYLIQDGRICNVPWNPTLPVHTAWDLGVADENAIWFFQIDGDDTNIIDYAEGSDKGLKHWINYINQKPYTYGSHIAPHDIEKRSAIDARTRHDIAAMFGLDFDIVIPKANSIEDDIESTRLVLPRCRFDRQKTDMGFECLKMYAYEFNERDGVFKAKPKHNKYSHGADAFRTLAMGIDEIKGNVQGRYVDVINNSTGWNPLESQEWGFDF